MKIEEKHILSKRRIGTLDGQPVVEVETTGGLFMVVCQKSGALEICGSGPHRAVARFIAQKRNKDLKIMELSKSQVGQLDQASIDSCLPKYEAMTDLLNTLLP
jgi:hypothetical protein